jgi:hypothetical protein
LRGRWHRGCASLRRPAGWRRWRTATHFDAFPMSPLPFDRQLRRVKTASRVRPTTLNRPNGGPAPAVATRVAMPVSEAGVDLVAVDHRRSRATRIRNRTISAKNRPPRQSGLPRNGSLPPHPRAERNSATRSRGGNSGVGTAVRFVEDGYRRPLKARQHDLGGERRRQDRSIGYSVWRGSMRNRHGEPRRPSSGADPGVVVRRVSGRWQSGEHQSMRRLPSVGRDRYRQDHAIRFRRGGTVAGSSGAGGGAFAGLEKHGSDGSNTETDSYIVTRMRDQAAANKVYVGSSDDAGSGRPGCPGEECCPSENRASLCRSFRHASTWPPSGRTGLQKLVGFPARAPVRGGA